MKTRYEVQWCVKLAFNSCGDVDIDNCDMAFLFFPTLPEARTQAELVWPETTNTTGLVIVTEQEWDLYGDYEFPTLGRWINTYNRYIYSGEWEDT